MARFAKKERLGDKMIELGLINEEQLNQALEDQRKTGDKLGVCLQKQGAITEQQMLQALESQYGIPSVDLTMEEIQPEVLERIPASLARRHKIIPVKIQNNVLYIAIEDPFNFLALDDARLISGMEVKPMIAIGESIDTFISRLYPNEDAQKFIEQLSNENITVQDMNITEEAADVDSAPVVRLVQSILDQAVKERSSDIHIEPFETEVRIRYRVDGALYTAMKVPIALHQALTTRLKIMSSLDIAERRIPQDGRFNTTIRGKKIDIRISVLPTIYGEKIVMRLLDRESFMIDKDQLGLSKENMRKFNEIINQPSGMILVTGPTGSGKTTTLYSILNQLNKVRTNIITIEDPVEYILPGLNQVQVNNKANLTFATGLRAILRQDPDVIMVGEIRDSETVEMAIRAAITGHLVLSTIHTRDSAGTITRLADMGIEPYLISASLIGIMAQRLMRVICPRCKKEYKPTPSELKLARMEEYKGKFYKGTGCSFCNETGYRGRTAIYEIMVIDRFTKNLINDLVNADILRDRAVKNGMTTLYDEAKAKVMEGVTTIDELLKVSLSNDE